MGEGAELRDRLTSSAYILRAAYVQKHRKRKLVHVWLAGYPDTTHAFSLALEC